MSQESFTEKMYTEHHRVNREVGFSILKNDRGAFFKDHIGTGKKVLDIGCRDGALTSFFTSGNNVTGVDIDPVALARAKQELGIETMTFDLHGDWAALSGRTFDVIVAGEVLEHLFYPDKVTAHVARHLTPEGMFIGSVPNAFSLKNRARYLTGKKRNTPLSDPTHINHFSVADLRAMLSQYFNNVEISGLGKYRRLAKKMPAWFAFDLVFIATHPKSHS